MIGNLENHSAGRAGADSWETPAETLDPHEVLRIDIDGFEGPLDLLLALARAHKLDLVRISISALADQYISFIAQARALRMELAADYLVMAAWLAFLKSKLLLPKEEALEDEPDGEELAAHLAFRLQRLAAMREKGATLANRNRLGRDVFPRGMPEGVKTVRTSAWEANVYDLLAAYARQRQRNAVQHFQIRARPVWSLKHARQHLEKFLTGASDWTAIDTLLARALHDSQERRTAVASTFGASLEMAREGNVDLKQHAAFEPLYVRRRLHAVSTAEGTPA